MAKSTKNTASKVVIETGLTVTPVPTALDILRDELSALKTITETEYRTDGKVDSFSGNIKEEKNVDTLIKMWSVVRTRAKFYNEAQEDLDVKEAKPFAMGGFGADAFKADIKLRIAVLKHSERKAELEALVTEGVSYLTKDDQHKIYMAKVAAALSRA